MKKANEFISDLEAIIKREASMEIFYVRIK